MSSTVSCSSAAHSVSVSSRMPAQIFATPTGWMMKSSPDLRRWSAWCSQANTNACSTASRSTVCGDLVGVLLDDREQVGEQLALEVGEVGGRGLQRGASAWPSAGAVDRRGAPDARRRRRRGRASASVPGSGCRSLCAARQESASVLESSAGRPGRPPSARARCARRPATVRAGPSRSRTDEAQLGEDSHQPARERRRPRLGAVSGEHRLAGLPAAHRRPRAGRGRRRRAGRAGRSPIRVFVVAKRSSGSPRPGGSSPAPGRCSSARRRRGRVERDHVREPRRQARVVARARPRR